MGKTATLFKAELGQSKAASPANVPNSYEVWQAQQGCNLIGIYFVPKSVPSDFRIVPKLVPKFKMFIELRPRPS